MTATSRLHLMRTLGKNSQQHSAGIDSVKFAIWRCFCLKSLLKNYHFEPFLVKHDLDPKFGLWRGRFVVSILYFFKWSFQAFLVQHDLDPPWKSLFLWNSKLYIVFVHMIPVCGLEFGMPFHAVIKSLPHLTWVKVWWSLGSYKSMFRSVLRGEYFWWLWWSFGLTHPCSTTLWTPDHSTSIIMRQCKDKGHISHPRKATIHIQRGEGGKGVKMGTLHWGGEGGGCQTWIKDNFFAQKCAFQ